MSPFQKHGKLYTAWLLAILVALIAAVFNSKGELVLFFHSVRIAWVTELFEVLTRLGETQGFILALLMTILVGTYRNLLTLILASLSMLLFVYLLKHYAFPDAVRPIVFFEKLGLDINYRPDYHLNRKHTFPSGHSTAAFVFFFSAALFTRRVWLQLIALTIAILVAFSRVYLMQHFVLDTIAGSVLGVMIATIWFAILKSPGEENLDGANVKQGFLNKSILNIHERTD